jgi:hypothetical protein
VDASQALHARLRSVLSLYGTKYIFRVEDEGSRLYNVCNVCIDSTRFCAPLPSGVAPKNEKEFVDLFRLMSAE